jgi:cysteine-rich repeat protein
MASNPASAAGTYCSGIGFGGTCNGAGQCIPSVVCGDGVIGAGEQCDDGNTNNGDGCSSTCLLELPALVVSGFPSPVANNVSGSITVTAKNANNLNAVGYTGTVHFTSNDPSATLPANYTFTLMDGGVRVFSGIKFVTSGSRSITVTDINNAGVTGTQNITVLP